ncbi:hypothetical protein HPP92_012242 [Vanilla planifolia]|uniref:tRNA (guanine(26)-N(2))-dimethyltransferase n=1 Tax=Vanilla planifolia TaxID=51239 RepID=A0A835QZ50_VANPL|nr:hypothetical protein HPP92_012242 [Vanilla planifolia]
MANCSSGHPLALSRCCGELRAPARHARREKPKNSSWLVILFEFLRRRRRRRQPSLLLSFILVAQHGGRRDELNDYTIIKEGEAEILMHSSNTVFFNKAQVNNRDISIAVLRTFVEKRKEEYAAMLNRKVKPESKINEVTPDSTAPESTNVENEETAVSVDMPTIGIHYKQENRPFDASADVSAEPIKTSLKVHRVLDAPKVLEALAASGLRALRYAREVDGIGPIIALDNDEESIKACKRNIKFNGSTVCSKVEAYHADARVYMLTNQKKFDAVDLDPYGSPSVFLDSAVQSVADGGLLMCTATDMAVLCGGNGEVCYSKYGSYPLKGKYCHEMALRILLACIESHANRYKRFIVPILSVQMDFYIRVFVRIFTSASAIKNTPLKLSYVYQCIACDSFHLQSVGRTVTKNNSMRYAPGFGPIVPQDCRDCGKKFNMGGPIWSAPMHDLEWVISILANVKAMKDRYPAYDKILSVLTNISEPMKPLQCKSNTVKIEQLQSNIFVNEYVRKMFKSWERKCISSGVLEHMIPMTGGQGSPEVAFGHGRTNEDKKTVEGLKGLEMELHDVPLFLSLHNLCGTLKCTSPSAVVFRSAVVNAGYRISGTHVNPLGLKTDAPMEVIWDIMRCWVKIHPIKAQSPDRSGSVILSKEPTIQANFTRAVSALSKAQAKKVARFLPNPERHWGPKVRAGRQISSKHASLLGPEAIQGLSSIHAKGNTASQVLISHQEQEDDGPEQKRQKTVDEAASN